MVRVFLILIFLLIPWGVWGWDCPLEETMVITAPRSGIRTYRDSIAIRGFFCEKIHYVVVKNDTTERSTLTDTDEVCDGEDCIYTFSTLVNGLAMGSNRLTATVPGHDPPIEIHIEVIRTALASNW